MRASLPRFGRSRGISTVVGTIFLVLVVFVICTNVFLWTMIQNTRYNQAVKESQQMDADRLSERIATSYAKFTVPKPRTVQVDVTVFNEGPVPAQVITAWVLWTVGEETKYGVNDTLNISLNPGEKLPVTIRVDVPDVPMYPTGAFSGWLVTARGNLVSLEKEKIVVTALVAKGIGSVAMDFKTFKYYEVGVGNKLIKYPEGNSAFKVPAGPNIVFAVLLSNYDLDERTITLHSSSLLWAYFPQSATPKNVWWYIVNVASDGTIVTTSYTPVSLAYGESKWIFFGSSYDLGQKSFSPVSIDGKQFVGYSAAVNLILLGKIDGEEYGQNIPFVSVYVEESK